MSIDTSGWWWMLPLGVGVVIAVDKIGKMGEPVAGLGLSSDQHRKEAERFLAQAQGSIKEADDLIKVGGCYIASKAILHAYGHARAATAHAYSIERLSPSDKLRKKLDDLLDKQLDLEDRFEDACQR